MGREEPNDQNACGISQQSAIKRQSPQHAIGRLTTVNGHSSFLGGDQA